MKQKTLIGGAVILILVGAYLATRQHTDHTSSMTKEDHVQDGTMDHSMMVNSEEEFITMMIPHHQEAIDSAKIILAASSSSAEIILLAENILIAQEQEVTTMMDWHIRWFGSAYEPSNTYTPMMRDLSSLTGTELDKAFLEDMIPHHQGALMMAESVQPHITRDELRGFTAGIITTQSEEIKAMRELLKTL